MKILKFKTNIQSEEEVKAIGFHLDQDQSISRWNIDTDNPDHVLSVSGEGIEPHQIKNTVEHAGYQAETIHIFGAGGGDV